MGWLPHFHRFRPRADWGIDGHCRCGMAKRRMMGGWGYALPGGFWFDDDDLDAHRVGEER